MAVSTYETAWIRTDKGARLGQIAAICQAFGVCVSANERELQDHIGTELEFAALLCVKEALAERDEQRCGASPADRSGQATSGPPREA